MKRYLYLGLLGLAVACAAPSPQKIDQDKTLFEIGNSMFDKKHYSDATPYFEEIKNRFPDSPYAMESELKVADCHYFTNDYSSAQVEYESFRTLHPTNEKIPYVYLQIGKAQMAQAPSSVQKDLTETEQALATFSQLTSRWPNSDEAAQSRPFVREAEEKLARKKLYLANFYIGQHKYYPALRRLESLNSDDTPSPLRREALFKLGLVHLKMDNPSVARQAFQKLVDEKIDDKYQSKAERYLKKIPEEKTN